MDGNAPDAFGAFVFEWSARDVAAQGLSSSGSPLLSDGQSVAGTTMGAWDQVRDVLRRSPG